MKNRDIKLLFYTYCKTITYIPSIFIDEIWDYLMSTIGKFIGSDKMWEQFLSVAINVYNYDTNMMEKDIKDVAIKISALFYEKYKEYKGISLNKNTHSKMRRFNDIKNGIFLSMDLKDAYIQAMLYYNIIEQNDIDYIFNVNKNGNVLKNCKWIKAYAFNRIGNKNIAPILCKNLLYETMFIDDPLINLLSKDFFISGDRLLIQITENEIQLFEKYIGNNYTCSNGVSFFIDICYKTSFILNDFPEIHFDNTINSIKHFASNTYIHTVNYDVYPQIYKYIMNENIEKYDLSYGFDDMVYFYNKKIWGS